MSLSGYRRRILGLMLLRPEEALHGQSAGSDVDLMLVEDLGFREAGALLHPTQAEIGLEVSPKIFVIGEFSGKLHSDPFLADVMSKPKLFVVGNARDLEELARHQSR